MDIKVAATRTITAAAGSMERTRNARFHGAKPDRFRCNAKDRGFATTARLDAFVFTPG